MKKGRHNLISIVKRRIELQTARLIKFYLITMADIAKTILQTPLITNDILLWSDQDTRCIDGVSLKSVLAPNTFSFGKSDAIPSICPYVQKRIKQHNKR